MFTFNFPTSAILSKWVLAIGVLIATFLLALASQSILKRLHRPNLRILPQLAPSVFYLVLVMGLKAFADIAPFSGKFEIWIDNTVYILGVVALLRLIQKSIMIAIEWSSLRAHQSEIMNTGFVPLMRNLTTLFVFFTGGIMVLSHLKYDVMSLVTALGVGSLAIGLAAKDTLTNMISGFILIIDRNLQPGDRINLGGHIGDVQEIGLRSTQIKICSDGNTLIVPNSELVNTKILNFSMPSSEIICTVTIRISYVASFPKVKGICFSILNQLDHLSKNNLPWVNLVSLAEGHQLLQISFWITDLKDSGAAISQFNEKLLYRLQQEKIDLVPPLNILPLSPLRQI